MSTRNILGFVLTVILMAGASERDEIIARNVAHLLSAHEAYRGVTFTVEDEIVTARGKVPTYTNRKGLEWSLRRIAHVRNVRNEVVLDPPVVSDEVLEARMKKMLTAAEFAHLRVVAHDGRVEVRGTVRTRTQWAQVLNLAWSVIGVREVETQVRVAEE